MPCRLDVTRDGQPPEIVVLISMLVASALAAELESTRSLYDVVLKKFADLPESLVTLEEVKGAPPDSLAVHRLANELMNAEQSDPYFAIKLRDTWDTVKAGETGHSATPFGRGVLAIIPRAP